MPSLSRVAFNTVKPLAIVCKGSAENKYECGKTIVEGSFYLQLFGDNCMKIIITRQIFLSNYELSRFPK
jgi:hypothetical protein